MYECDECGRVFEHPIKCYGDLLDCRGAPTREKWKGSPCCESSYHDVMLCEMCGEAISNYSGELLCQECGELSGI